MLKLQLNLNKLSERLLFLKCASNNYNRFLESHDEEEIFKFGAVV